MMSSRTDGEQRAAEVAEGLQRVTDAALAYLNLDDLLTELLVRTVDVLDADTAAILLLEEDGKTLAARAAKGLEEEVEQGFRLEVGAGFAGRVAATQAPVIIEDLERSPIEVVNPLLRRRGIRSLLGVPMAVEGRLIGVMHVGTLTPRTFTDDDVHLLRAVADRAAMGIDHNRLFVQYRIAESLQRRLLPERLPEVPGLEFAARYIPAAEATTVGGDWYDVFTLSDGRVALTIGDVVGHGVAAASLMGELRTALRVYGLEQGTPAQVMRKLARFVGGRGLESMATCAYATVDLERSTVTLASAGHPPPLVVSAEAAVYVDQHAGPPLGAKADHPYEEVEFALDCGAVVVLYTDGVIERRGHLLSEGQERLASVAATAPLEPELLSAKVVEALPMHGPDDVAVLAMQNLTAANGRLTLTLSARAEQLIVVRRALRRWLHDGIVTPADVSATVLATNEACSNAIEHAYGPGEATFDVLAERQDRTVEVTVRDQGRWREPRGENRGRGLGLMRAAMDEVEVVPGEAGTTVRMSRRLGNEGVGLR
jgi:anti-sigma regulatory factor (Ser/Thr protein kinase)/putative methionine-R-sulfoxide reductase with GAF domain